jgi:hypothetical protein
MKSNHFLKFSKTQNINTKQEGASFHTKTSFHGNFINLAKGLYLHNEN